MKVFTDKERGIILHFLPVWMKISTLYSHILSLDTNRANLLIRGKLLSLFKGLFKRCIIYPTIDW